MEATSEWTFDLYDRAAPPPSHGKLPALAQICSACTDLFSGLSEVQALKDTKTHPFPQSHAAIQVSAESGCQICYMYLETSSVSEKLQLDGCLDIRYRFWGRPNSAGKLVAEGLTLNFYPLKLESGQKPISKGLLIMNSRGTSKSLMEFDRREASNDSQTSNDIIGYWLLNCKNNHTDCRNLPMTAVKPKRLLYLGQGVIIRPRLCLTETLPRDIRYVTLSHCWGQSQPLRLVKNSLAAMMEKIEILLLSQTFRDAMETTRRQKIDYIWIDSLCIIQDDEEDWRVESAIMGDIYQNAEINIAAARVSAREDGCYARREISRVTPCIVEARWSNAEEYTYVVSNPDLWGHRIEQSPLLSRAWVIQEVILARRVVYFADDQIFWECCELQANETYPKGILGRSSRKLNPGDERFHSLCRIPEEPSYDKYLLWDKIVSMYSNGWLTYPQKDKLVAMSSLSKKMNLEDECIAGLWRKRLPQQLLWRTGDGTVQRSQDYQAPSWSWASLNGNVHTQLSENSWSRLARASSFRTKGTVSPREEKSLINVVDIKIDHKDGDVRAQLAGTILKLWAPIVVAPVKKVEDSADAQRYLFGKAQCRVHGDNLVPNVKGGVYCLVILAVQEGNSTFHGIFIRPTAKGEYVRLGYCCVMESFADGNFNEFERMLRAGLGDSSGVEDVDLLQEDQIPRYLVNIR